MAQVEDPAQSYHLLKRVVKPRRIRGRTLRGFNPLHPDDQRLFAAVQRGEHALHGFRNADLRRQLYPAASTQAQRRLSARVSRLLQRLRAHDLIAKFPRSRRYRLTRLGHQVLSAAIHLANDTMPTLLQPQIA